MSGLLDLAERCEKVEGPDRELDALIFIATSFPEWRLQTDCEPFPDEVQPGRIQEGENFGWREAPTFTASLDAAMTLVPEGWRFNVSTGHRGIVARANCDLPPEVPFKPEDWLIEHSRAATPALALCAAALRARAGQAA